MEEENKNENKIFSKKKKTPENIEIKEIRLEKMSPGFNLVSLKARHRLNELKNIFSRSEYKEYIRKCKNMYSISSIMNKKYSISDLYLREKYDINDIVSVFNKIDSKLDFKKIKVARVKKDKINKDIKQKSKTAINFFIKNNSNLEKFKFNNNLINFYRNKEENKSLSFNNNNKMNYTSYDVKNNFSNIINDEIAINNKMSKTNYENRNNKSKIANYKNQYSLIKLKNNYFGDINKIKDFNNNDYPNIFSRNKNAKDNNIYKSENKNYIKLSKLNRNNSDFSGIYNMESKQMPFSCKNNCFNITKFGAIIYNCSMLRNKSIVNFIPNYYNLPIMYKNINN